MVKTGFDNGKKPLGFELREIHNLIKMQIHKMRPPCARPGTPLTQLQGGILAYLYHHDPAEPVYQKNIEEVFRISRATATNTLQVMEKNGLIVRKTQDQDGRLKRIFMTEEAYKEHTQMEKAMQKLDEDMLAGMSPEESDQFMAFLNRVRDNLEHMNNDRESRMECGSRTEGGSQAECESQTEGSSQTECESQTEGSSQADA